MDNHMFHMEDSPIRVFSLEVGVFQ
jgi:hypothetical protein